MMLAAASSSSVHKENSCSGKAGIVDARKSSRAPAAKTFGASSIVADKGAIHGSRTKKKRRALTTLSGNNLSSRRHHTQPQKTQKFSKINASVSRKVPAGAARRKLKESLHRSAALSSAAASVVSSAASVAVLAVSPQAVITTAINKAKKLTNEIFIV